MNPSSRALGRRLRFSQLELVLEVAACGNLGEAAQRLHLTRAGVSKSIKDLERTLGQVLFERSAQGMRATPAGVRVAKHAQLLVNELQHLTDEAAAADGGGRGLLRIGLQPFVGEYVLPTILQRLHAAGGGDTAAIVHLHEGRLHALIEQLLRGEIDAAMVLYAPHAVDALDLSMLDIRPFMEVPMVVVAAPALEVPARRHTWASLRAHPWVLPPASTHQRRALDEMFTARGSQPPLAVIDSPSFATNVELAAAGFGLALVPRQSAARALDEGRVHVVEVGPSLPPTSVALIYRKVSAIYMDALRALERALEAPPPARAPGRQRRRA